MQVLNSECNPVETGAPFVLQLQIEDPDVLDYLQSFPPEQRESKALEALRVGVIALRSVTPALDTSIVDRKFGELERNLEEYTRDFSRELSRLVRDQVGPESEFGKVVDPLNSVGLLQRIEKSVDAKLQETAADVLSQFSLDKSDSALARLQGAMNVQVEQIKSEMGRFFADLKELHGLARGRAEEAVKGTQKGRDFESEVYDRLAEICRSMGDLSENLTATPGNISRCKTGDYLSTLASDSGAAGVRIVFEAKKKEGYTLRNALEELKQARENRGAAIGVMVFSQECCPVEVGAFRIVDSDILVGLDLEHPERAAFYLESCYRIARAMAVLTKRQELSAKLDANKLASVIARVEKACERFADINKKASSIKQNAASIEEIAEGLRFEIEHELHEIDVVIRSDRVDDAQTLDESQALC
jgi:hypothetical protein